MRVLLVNHTSTISGGEHSLLELLRSFPDDVSAVLACPAGPLADAARDAGIIVELLPKTDGSLKLHPWHTAKGLVTLAWSGLRIRRLAARHSCQVIHANSIRAGLSAVLATRLGGPPAVVHVRDCLPAGRASAAVRRYLQRRSAALVGNSLYTLERFEFAERGVVVHNAVDLDRFDRDASGPPVRDGLGLRASSAVLGVVAQLTPWKGQDDAISALALLKAGGADVELLLVGSAKFTSAATRHDNISYIQGLHELVHSLGLEDDVHFLGERTDVPQILGTLDLLLLPSWEEPFGRAVIEAFALGVPVVATDVGGTCEIVSDGEDGVLRPPRDPAAWAEAVAELLREPQLMAQMGRRARQTALRRFSREQHAHQVLAVYESVIRGAGAQARQSRYASSALPNSSPRKLEP